LSPAWQEKFSSNMANESDASWYLAGLYWGVSSVISGASYQVPTSELEFIFSTIVVIFGLLLTSFIVAVATSDIVELRSVNREKNEQMRLMKSFLYQHKVSRRLQLTLIRQASNRLKEGSATVYSEITLLKTITMALKLELLIEVSNVPLRSSEILNVLLYLDEALIRSLALKCVSMCDFPSGEVVVQADAEASSMYILTMGTMEYTATSQDLLCPVNPLSRLCEIALFAEWCTRGVLATLTACELLNVDILDFWTTLTCYSLLGDVLHTYSEALLNLIQDLKPRGLNDISIGVEHDQVALSMPAKYVETMSRPGVKFLGLNLERESESLRRQPNSSESFGPAASPGKNKQIRRGKKGFEKLVDEVGKGKCILSLRDGVCLRVVPVAVLDLRQAEEGDLQCIQVGKQKGDDVEVDIELPGTKVSSGETPLVAIKRLVQSEFPALANLIDINRPVVETNIEVKDSKSYGIRTKYIRTKFRYKLSRSNITHPDYMVQECDLSHDLEVMVFTCKPASNVTRLYAWLGEGTDLTKYDAEKMQSSLQAASSKLSEQSTTSPAIAGEGGYSSDARQAANANEQGSTGANTILTECVGTSIASAGAHPQSISTPELQVDNAIVAAIDKYVEEIDV